MHENGYFQKKPKKSTHFGLFCEKLVTKNFKIPSNQIPLFSISVLQDSVINVLEI